MGLPGFAGIMQSGWHRWDYRSGSHSLHREAVPSQKPIYIYMHSTQSLKIFPNLAFEKKNKVNIAYIYKHWD